MTVSENSRKKYNQRNGFGKIINENKKDSLLKCKKIIEINTVSKIYNMKDRNFYIFCLDRNSYALSKILLKHKFKIKKIKKIKTLKLIGSNSPTPPQVQAEKKTTRTEKK